MSLSLKKKNRLVLDFLGSLRAFHQGCQGVYFKYRGYFYFVTPQFKSYSTLASFVLYLYSYINVFKSSLSLLFFLADIIWSCEGPLVVTLLVCILLSWGSLRSVVGCHCIFYYRLVLDFPGSLRGAL